MKRSILIVAVLLAVSGQAWGAVDVKIAITADAHYNADGAGSNLADLQTVASKALVTEGASYLFLLGDTTDNVTNRAGSQAVIAGIKAGLTSYSNNIYTLAGGHDLLGTNITQLVADYGAAPASPLMPAQNYTVDVGTSWRVILIDLNEVGPIGVSHDSADQTTLDWLTAALATAKADGKYIVILSHPGFGLNYPGTGTVEFIAPGSVAYETVTAQASATTGSVTITASADVFTPAMATGNHRLVMNHSETWGKAYITAYTDNTHVTATVEQDFGAANTNADEWILIDKAGSGAESTWATNAQEVRAIVAAAKADSTNVMLALNGNGHTNYKTTVDGIDYIMFRVMSNGKTAANMKSFGILTLNTDGTYFIAGAKDQTSYDIDNSAKTWFVDITNGDNNNESGRLRSSPYQTIAKPNTAGFLVPGNTVTVLGGAYTEALVPAVAGTPGLPINWILEDGFATTISAATGVSIASKAYLNITGQGTVTFTGYTTNGVALSGTMDNNIFLTNLQFTGNGAIGFASSDNVASDNVMVSRCKFGGSPTLYNVYLSSAAKARFDYDDIGGSKGTNVIRTANTAYGIFNNNTIVGTDNTTSIMQFFNSSHADIVNSILTDVATTAKTALTDSSDQDTNVSYSIFRFNQTFAGDLIDGGNNLVNKDPKLVSATDHRLRASSPAINAGVAITGLHPGTDYAGNPVPFLGGKVDIGSYEFQSGDPWTIGGGGKFITFPRFPFFPSFGQ